MKHYQKNHSMIEIFPGSKDLDNDLYQIERQKVDNMYDSLFQFCDGDVDNVFTSAEPLGKGSLSLLNKFKSQIEGTSESSVSHTVLMSSMFSWARLCYSLYYYSCIKANKNDFFVESCGTSNVVLLVKGGKKILSTKRSRLFQVIIETNKESAEMMSGSSTKITVQNGRYFCVYPWREISLSYIKLFLELPYRFTCFSVSSIQESGLSYDNFKKYAKVKVLACLSQKRKLEIWLGFF